MKAVRFIDPSGGVRIGRLDEDVVVDAGPVQAGGFVPTRAAWDVIATAAGAVVRRSATCELLHPVEPAQADRDRDQLPRPRRGVGARPPGRAARVRDVAVGARRPRRDDRDPARGDAARLRGRGRDRDRPGAEERVGRGGARRDRRLLGVQRRVGPARAARDAAAPVHARQELRHVLPDGAVPGVHATASTSAAIGVRTTIARRGAPGVEHAQPDLPGGRARRVLLARA